MDDQIPTYSNNENNLDTAKKKRTSRHNWFYKLCKYITTRLRPKVWEFFNDQKSSIGASVI